MGVHIYYFTLQPYFIYNNTVEFSQGINLYRDNGINIVELSPITVVIGNQTVRMRQVAIVQLPIRRLSIITQLTKHC